MPRLIDDIRAARRLDPPPFIDRTKLADWNKHVARLVEFLETPALPVLLVDQVAHYFYEVSGKEVWSLERDFKNLTPPYSVFWCEHVFPRFIHSDSFGITMNRRAPHGRSGILFLAAEPENVRGEGIPPKTAWILCGDQFVDYGTGRIFGPPGTWIFAIDGAGKILGSPSMQSFTAPEHNQRMREQLGFYYPSLLALSVIDAKGIAEVDDREPTIEIQVKNA